MPCIMLTGDAPLTALSVAQEVAIAKKQMEKTLLLQEKGGTDSTSKWPLEWAPALQVARLNGEKPRGFVAGEVEELSREYDLATGRGRRLLAKDCRAPEVSQEEWPEPRHCCSCTVLSGTADKERFSSTRSVPGRMAMIKRRVG